MLDVALGTACLPADVTGSAGGASIVHLNNASCRSRVLPPPPTCRCGVGCSFFTGGIAAASLSADPAVSGPFAYAVALCASGGCSASGTSSGISITPLVTASDVTIANVSDPLVSSGSSGASARRLALAAAAAAAAVVADVPSPPLSARRGLRSTAAAAVGLTFSRPSGGGVAQPMSINPGAVGAVGGAVASPAHTSRRLDWYSESLASSYVPPTPALPGIPVTTRAAAAGPLGIGSSMVRKRV